MCSVEAPRKLKSTILIIFYNTPTCNSNKITIPLGPFYRLASLPEVGTCIIYPLNIVNPVEPDLATSLASIRISRDISNTNSCPRSRTSSVIIMFFRHIHQYYVIHPVLKQTRPKFSKTFSNIKPEI